MRRALLAAVVLSACSAHGMNFLPRTRRLHESFDLVVKHLEAVLPTLKQDSQAWRDVAASLHHMRPIRTQFGGEIRWGAAVPGSTDELELIAAQYGHAKDAVNMQEVREEIKEGIWRWFKRRLFDLALASLWWLPLAAWLYFNRRKLKALFVASDEEQVALRRRIDELYQDKELRAQTFADPVIHRGHQRLKAEGKL